MSANEHEFRRLVDLVGAYHDEAQKCADDSCWRAACVMIAAALEAGLLALIWVSEEELKARGFWPLEKPSDPDRGLRKAPPERWHGRELVRLARRAGWLPAHGAATDQADDDNLTDAEVDEMLDFVSEVRNIAAHPGKYIRKGREMPGLDLDQKIYQTAYEIVRAAFDHTYTVVLKPLANPKQNGQAPN